MWFVFVGIVSYLFAPVFADRLPGIGAWRYAVSFAFAVLLGASVLVHELSHTLVALRLGLPVRRIVLQLLGGVSEIEREPESAGRELAVAVAGPLLSLVLGLVGVGLTHLLDAGGIAHTLAASLAFTNFVVAVFNMLPGLPLDGGRVLRAAVWGVTGRQATGTLIAAWAGRVLAVLVVLLPFVLAWRLGTSPDPFDLVWGLLMASFIWVGASQALMASKVRERLPALSVRGLMRPATVVDARLPLAEALRQVNESGAGALVVADGDGAPTGVVVEAAVNATPVDRRPWVATGSLARSLETTGPLAPDLAGEDLLVALRASPASEYLVLDGSGGVLGVLATSDIEQVLSRS